MKIIYQIFPYLQKSHLHYFPIEAMIIIQLAFPLPIIFSFFILTRSIRLLFYFVIKGVNENENKLEKY